MTLDFRLQILDLESIAFAFFILQFIFTLILADRDVSPYISSPLMGED